MYCVLSKQKIIICIKYKYLYCTLYQSTVGLGNPSTKHCNFTVLWPSAIKSMCLTLVPFILVLLKYDCKGSVKHVKSSFDIQ